MFAIRKSILRGSLAAIVLIPAAAAWSQSPQQGPELLPTPPAVAPPQREVVPYGSLDAVEESYQRGEAKRRWGIERQGNLIRDMWWYNTWVSPYVGTLEDIYAFGSRRAVRRAYREGTAPVFTPWPRVPGDIYGYPYYPPVKQPLGHERIQTGPNSYIYRPIHASPEEPAAAAPEPPAPPKPTPYQRPPSAGPREF